MAIRVKGRAFFAGLLLALGGVAFATTFQFFQPATGILKGNASTYVTTAAASSDIISLWSGTCNSSSFLRGDGACAAAGGGSSPANPTGTVGLSAVNGAASTFMRSDAAPPLSQSITPVWTGLHVFNAGYDMQNLSAPTTNRRWNTAVYSGGSFAITACDDTGMTCGDGISLEHGTNDTVSAITIGVGAGTFSLLSDTSVITGSTITLDANGAQAVLDNGTGNVDFTVAGDVSVNGSPLCRMDGTNCPSSGGVTQTTGTFTATLSTGCTTTPSVTARYVLTGSQVTLTIPALSCTNNSGTVNVTSLPAGIVPAGNVLMSIRVQDNGVWTIGYALISASSTITYSPAAAAFSGTGTLSLGLHTISYNLN